MGVYDWSTTPANNDDADSGSGINWAEDQAPSTVNDSARSLMAEIAKWVKDTNGALVTTGSSSAYAVTTNQTILAHTAPVMLAIEANHTSTGASTIAIDSLATKPLKRSNGAAIQAGDLVSGSIYLIAYEAGADVYLCLNVAGNYDPSNVAITGGTISGLTSLAAASATISTDITVPNTGLHILDTNASHDLIVKPGSNLTADHTLTITTGDADRTLTLGGDFTANGGTVSSGTHSGTNTGDQTITLTGDVTGTGTGSFAATIANGAVSLAKMADIATARFIGRTTASTGVPEALTGTQATALLNNAVGDSGSGGTKGLVPAPSAGDAAANKFLKADATWAAVPGVDYQAFTSDGTWTKPSGTSSSSRVLIQIWGAGGGGSSVNNGGGGGGGAYREVWKLASDLGSTETVTVGSGGSATNAGGNSSFGAHGTAYGGGGGGSSGAGGAPGGGGGGISSAGSSVGSGSTGGNGGNPSGGAGGDSSGTVNGGDSTLGGGGGGDNQSSNGGDGGSSIFGGGGGGGGANSSGGTDNGGDGGNSVYGGGGGGAQGADNNGSGGTSLYGGNGGGNGSAGTAPGGGGGRNAAGARGEVRVTVFK